MWLYKQGSGEPSSWERYTVRASQDDMLLIDMASKFSAGEEYVTHHCMKLSLSDNLSAADSHSDWSLREFSFRRGGDWQEAPHRDNVQAFEEKFNAFLMAPSKPAKVSVLRQRERQTLPAFGRMSLVQSRRHEYTGAWYITEPRSLAGLAAYKSFGREGAPDSFTFELIEMGRAETTDGMGPLSTSTEGRNAFG